MTPNPEREPVVDENEVKARGVRPPVDPDDVHGYDTWTASPHGTGRIEPSARKPLPEEPEE